MGESTQIDLSLGMGDAVHFTGGLNLSEKWLAEIGASQGKSSMCLFVA